jgi:hypothetical protein
VNVLILSIVIKSWPVYPMEESGRSERARGVGRQVETLGWSVRVRPDEDKEGEWTKEQWSGAATTSDKDYLWKNKGRTA